ncbi:MAG: hypothetical protein PHU25_18640, partial [Deltaproteobacteria bacterium]|nr:hypothetical protein [Deltaproteobacteria bacterium]
NPADPQMTVAWNTELAWVLEITKWDVREYDPKGELFQDAGRASGRVAVCFKAGGRYQNSWVAGTFENAVVRYLGKPPWVAAKAEPKPSGGKVSGGGAGSGDGGGAASKAKEALKKAKGEDTVQPEPKPDPKPDAKRVGVKILVPVGVIKKK